MSGRRRRERSVWAWYWNAMKSEKAAQQTHGPNFFSLSAMLPVVVSSALRINFVFIHYSSHSFTCAALRSRVRWYAQMCNKFSALANEIKINAHAIWCARASRWYSPMCRGQPASQSAIFAVAVEQPCHAYTEQQSHMQRKSNWNQRIPIGIGDLTFEWNW